MTLKELRQSLRQNVEPCIGVRRYAALLQPATRQRVLRERIESSGSLQYVGVSVCSSNEGPQFKLNLLVGNLKQHSSQTSDDNNMVSEQQKRPMSELLYAWIPQLWKCMVGACGSINDSGFQRSSRAHGVQVLGAQA